MNFKKIGKILYKYWMKFAHILGTVNGYILLTVFYFVIIGLYAIPRGVFKFFFRDGDWNITFWKEKKDEEVNIEILSRQF